VPLPLVWTERESGDWEACVITAYLMGLLYGGAPIPDPYTQAEREALEVAADEPQDFDTTDTRAQARYGVQLRKLSTDTIAYAVTRIGVGLVMAGYGGLLIPTGAPIHAVFYVPATAIAGWLFDPLAPDRSAPVSIAASRMVAWSKGAGPNDVREVREDEFVPDADVQVRPYPTPRTWLTKGGVLVGRRLDPAPLVASQTFVAGSPAHSSAEYTITPTPAGWPPGPYQLVIDGGLAGYLVANSEVTLPDPVWPAPPSPGPTPAPAPAPDVALAVRAALRAALLDAAAALED
jgi:hypothetical protein